MAGMSSGDGRYSTTASSMGCTPLFLNAEPVSTGFALPAIVARRMPALISSIESSSPSRYFSMISSSFSASVSRSVERQSSASSCSSAGISSIA